MTTRLLQANLNRARGAQELLMQFFRERGCGLGIAAEPHLVLGSHPTIIGDVAGQGGKCSVAIFWQEGDASPPIFFVEKRGGYVAVEWGALDVVGVYAPPSWNLARFEHLLGRLGNLISRRPQRPVLVAGDLNVKSALWGSSVRCRRGGVLKEWVASDGLCTMNRGRRSTFVGPRGRSVIDVTFASPQAARLIQDWRMVTSGENLSDHRYIVVRLVATPEEVLRRRGQGGARPQRWALRKLDRDKLAAVLMAATWAEPGPTPRTRPAIEDEVAGIRDMMTAACDAAMPRSRSHPRRQGPMGAPLSYRDEALAQLGALTDGVPGPRFP
ncbi:uncharacterized protein LOC116844353 [Odontomachus brunneus]|uniref:uncharacterized protein LOC116844353 n=1 Tax=Odontomachus brunneus TaxID=486640 RepID=UPI0013F23C0D|nr:uncharacterized protein LOC116844353 [Odontomachus brunneus]